MQRVIHFEIYTHDPEAVCPFYQDVFGWTFKKFEGGPVEYWLVTTGDDKDPGINGGLARPREGQSPGTINTIAVPSLDQSIKRLKGAAARFVCRKWRSPMSAGSPTPKIRPATSLESLSHIRKQNSWTTSDYAVSEQNLHNRIN